jgi:hypothetical protein
MIEMGSHWDFNKCIKLFLGDIETTPHSLTTPMAKSSNVQKFKSFMYIDRKR